MVASLVSAFAPRAAIWLRFLPQEIRQLDKIGRPQLDIDQMLRSTSSGMKRTGELITTNLCWSRQHRRGREAGA